MSSSPAVVVGLWSLGRVDNGRFGPFGLFALYPSTGGVFSLFSLPLLDRADAHAPVDPAVNWDGRRFVTRSALRLHLEWSGASWPLWVRRHRKAFEQLPA